MSRLIDLYPAAWRERYGAELAELLAERPLAARDRLDLVRGAIDAHLDPQLHPAMPWTHRLPGLISVGIGAAWIAAILLVSPAAGSAESGTLVGLALLGMLLALPGDYLADHGRRIAWGIGAFVLALIATRLLLWPLLMAPFLAMYALVLGGSLTIAAIRAGIGTRTRWLLVVGCVLLPIVVLSATLGTGLVPESMAATALLVAIPYGVSWALIGLRMAIRGAPTFVDPAPAGLPVAQPEASA